MEPFDHLETHSHHVVALFREQSTAEKAIDALRSEGLPEEHFSLLIRHGDETLTDQRDHDKTVDVITGTTIGGAVGFIAGAIAFGIPGVGTVVGAGLWTATAVGAAIGATVGIEISDYHHAWEGQYRSAVARGETLVAVSTDEALTATEAAETFQSIGAEQVDVFDRHGKAIEPRG